MYINTFSKLKTEASGNAGWVGILEGEDLYIDSFYASEAIRLDKDAIKPNAAKRGLAKLCLNSKWGKLTEKNNRTKTKIISDPHELYRFFATPGIEVASLTFASDDVVWASWRFSEEEKIPNLRHTNELIGAYITAGVRLHLYSYLDRLQERAIYCDTDSFLYVQPRDQRALVETGTAWGP